MKPVYYQIQEQWFVLTELEKQPTHVVLGSETYKRLVKELDLAMTYYVSTKRPVFDGMRITVRPSIAELVVVY